VRIDRQMMVRGRCVADEVVVVVVVAFSSFENDKRSASS
jgi:hypothetical protein